MEERRFCFFICLKTLLRVYFKSPKCTEDQLKYPVFWTEHLLDSWTFPWEIAIVGLTVPKPVCHSKSTYSVCIIHSISPVPLENTNMTRDSFLHSVISSGEIYYLEREKYTIYISKILYQEFLCSKELS